MAGYGLLDMKPVGTACNQGRRMSDDEELRALREKCTRFLQGHGPVSPAQMLATIPASSQTDTYGDGGAVAELETKIAGLLGKPAAVFMPSGTMAQQSALRVHADRRNRKTILFHPMCHLDWHEEQGYQRLHGLIGRPVGDRNRLMTLDELSKVAEPPAALLIELPQRDLGGQQPDWDELAGQAGWARDRGGAVHMDGARLWESAAGYGRSPAEIAALFDTVYVSFYKGIGALPGCCVAGPEDVIAEVREWRRRMGGTLHGMWPSAASALTCLDRRLPRFPGYLEHARAIASALSGLPGVHVIPDPPQVPMMHLLLAVTGEGYSQAARRLAEEEAIWVHPKCATTPDPAVQRVELSVGDATGELTAAQVRDIFARLVGGDAR
jgi:threonine aldolase